MYMLRNGPACFFCTDEDILIFQSIYRLDNLLLKTFGVAVKVPNFSFLLLDVLFLPTTNLPSGVFQAETRYSSFYLV